MERRSEKGLQAKYDYIARYQKENYKTFSAQIKKEEYKEIKDYLVSKKMGNAEFIRYAYEKMLSGII